MKMIAALPLGDLAVLSGRGFSMHTVAIASSQLYTWQKPKQYAESHLLPDYQDADWASDYSSECDDLEADDAPRLDGCRRSPRGNQRVTARTTDGVRAWPGTPMATR